MNEAVQFRRMCQSDLDEVLKIEYAAFSHPWTRGIYREAIENYYCWVMLLGQQPIGHGVIQLIADEAHLLNITIKPENQGCGLGRILLNHLMEEAIKHGATECFLEVRLSNLQAYRLYERFGFNEIGRRKDYYPAIDGREDALVMAYSLLP